MKLLATKHIALYSNVLSCNQETLQSRSYSNYQQIYQAQKYKNMEVFEQPKAKVKYYIKALIYDHANKV